MEDSLYDVGMNALESLEAQDQQEQNNSEANTGEENKDANENAGDENAADNTSEETNDTTEDSNDADENGGETKETTNTEDKSDDDSDEEKKDAEMSDEEFEELAKKRGYAKAKTEDEQKTENEQKATMDKLLAKPKEIEEEAWDIMSDEQKIIYNALPFITAEGKNGTVQVKVPGQLPDGFEFKSQKAMMMFQNDLQAQENRATQFKNALEARAEREQRATEERQEAQRVIGEINKLQDSGELPKPTAKFGTREFDDDPAVALINKVLGYRAQRASEGVVLTVRDSLLLYKAEHPKEFAKNEAKGDAERANIAKKVAGNSKASSTAVNKDADEKPRYYRPGMSTEDVLDAVLKDMD